MIRYEGHLDLVAPHPGEHDVPAQVEPGFNLRLQDVGRYIGRESRTRKNQPDDRTCTRSPCITQLKAQGPSRTCNESKAEEEEEEKEARAHPAVAIPNAIV